jgi:uncharacterized protein (DUF427 family)
MRLAGNIHDAWRNDGEQGAKDSRCRSSHYHHSESATRSDVSTLERSELTTYCPYKGDYSAVEGRANVAWTYEEPYEAVSSIKNYLAFYPDRVDP